jgi:hypothetical protein
MVTILKIINSLTLIRANKYTAILPFTATSKNEMEGITDAKKYMLVIIIMALK